MGDNEEQAAESVAKVDVAALEERVHIAELLARQAEAEVRYLKAQMERKDMKRKGNERKGGDERTERKAAKRAAKGTDKEK
ncbi:MAG TPA: hypothetical protein VLV55_05590 [Rhizomicrobium sp.]|nr:hypothetical protein [Rhizomicrobium sp.]